MSENQQAVEGQVEGQSVTDEMRQLAKDLVAEVERKVKGSGATAEAQASYIVTNRLRERGLPPWAIDLLMELVMELIKKFMESRKGDPADGVPPVVETQGDVYDAM